MKLNEFKCAQCGECCRHLDKIEGLKHLQTNGICKYLEGNLCSIYDHRPDLCRRDKVYEMFKNQMSEEEFMNKVVEYCNYFQEVKKSNDIERSIH